MSIESERLANEGDAWRRWGPYLSDRAWGTVREDYSADGQAWDSFPHDHARSRVYRWNEDGLAGICDDQQRLCFALALWNGRDPILKERLFGLSGSEGNHGEDVKEVYFHLDSTPTHSYMKMLYKYPQGPFPYAQLVEVNRQRSRTEPEYELLDTGIFDEGRYFDVFVEYAKAGPNDILIRITAANRGPEASELHLLPTLWFRNTWSWRQGETVPRLREQPSSATAEDGTAELRTVLADHPTLGNYTLFYAGEPQLLFTENETNYTRLYGAPNHSPYVKDGIHEAVVNGRAGAVNLQGYGTKAAAHYRFTVGAGENAVVRLRLTDAPGADPFGDFDALFAQRQAEADAFYVELQARTLTEDERRVQRQAFAGLLWSKQFYHYDVNIWLKGDPAQPKPPESRLLGRNSEWAHFNSADILSMPDKWEYPYFAAWDLAFQCVPLALVDLDFAKQQLILLGRVWYQHPNGQIPAYEWSFGDANPPVLAWAAWRVYKTEQERRGTGDVAFLERVFHKLLLNFTWWVNRRDTDGMNIFQGGFLGLDNIGVFDRSAPLPTGGHIEQADGTSWMGMFCLNMLTIALELAQHNRVYEDIATKFFEHFLYIAGAMNNLGGEGIALWDDEDEFFYDVLHVRREGVDAHVPLKVRSMVGLIPLFAVATSTPKMLAALPDFRRRLEWFLAYRVDLASLISNWDVMGMNEQHLIALVRGHRMKRVLRRMLDPDEFLSPHGVRALSRHHVEHPFVLDSSGMHHAVAYEPGETSSAIFGGNSNWRGPVWFPVNYLIVESLLEFHRYYGDDFKVECPTGSGQYRTLREVAGELSQRLIGLFLPDDQGRRAVHGDWAVFQDEPHWRDYALFYEYFHGDTGAGLGASHQTGWTGLVATLIQQVGEARG